MRNWTECEGQVVDGQFTLRRYLGGGVRGGVQNAAFLTEYGASKAVIKFVPPSAAQLAAWEAAAKLEHPHLLRIFAGGEYRLGETDWAYVVTEYADENLALILDERPLTTRETQETVAAVVAALVYLHAKGFVHGALKPSNIMAIGDRVVLSSDTISSDSASPADDCLALGVVLKRCVPSLPAPFSEIVWHCLDPDPRTRWGAARVADRLSELSGVIHEAAAGAVAAPPQRSGGWISISTGLILALVAGMIWYGRSKQPEPGLPPAAPSKSKPAESLVTAPTATQRVSTRVVAQVLPDIPQAALNTIRGRVRINVGVSVDPSGSVTEATLEPPPASKYFSRFTLEAARRWKFQPSAAPQQWNLRFELLRDGAHVAAVPVSR